MFLWIWEVWNLQLFRPAKPLYRPGICNHECDKEGKRCRNRVSGDLATSAEDEVAEHVSQKKELTTLMETIATLEVCDLLRSSSWIYAL